MAPDLDKKREPRRAGAISHFGAADDTGGMQLLQRCSSASFFGDYYRHGTSAGVTAGVSLATPTSAALRSSSGSSSSAPPPVGSAAQTRAQQAQQVAANTRSRVGQQQPQPQQQQQQQRRQQQTRTSSLNRGTAASAIRGSNERLSSRSASGSTQDLCDNSNDSGLGFEERQQQLSKAAAWKEALVEEDPKRRKMDIKLESEDANFAFPEVVQGSQNEGKIATRNGIVSNSRAVNNVNGSVGRVVPVSRSRQHLGVLSKRAPPAHQGPITLVSQLNSLSRNGKTQLQIVCQPESQHRARYQTEGSRGAVKDRTGNGFPIVRLINYDKPATLQVFIGTDVGRVAPHMFYQACRVSGKNSTPCIERKVDGTIVIDVDMDPAKEMMVTCDCVGILKERNVDVEHRFPQEAGILQGRSKKKSTRCRMVFRTTITHDDGTNETLQVCSQPIVCTQPPGIPEICKKSLTSCPCTGGVELFIIGKNFLKDTRIIFQLDTEDLHTSLEPAWEYVVFPDKEFLQQTHLICVVPAYNRQDLAPSETIAVKVFAHSSGKMSEPHSFSYTAATSPPAPSIGKLDGQPSLSANNGEGVASAPLVVPASVTSNALLPQSAAGPSNFLGAIQTASTTAPAVSPEVLKSDPSSPPVTSTSSVTPVMMWSSPTTNGQATAADVMMPPPPNLVSNPLMNRRSSSSVQLILPDNLKTEMLDENSQSSLMGDNSLSGMPTTANGPVPGPMVEQLVSDNSRDSSQGGMIRTSVTSSNAPVQDALLGVVDLIRNQHPLAIVPQQPTFNGLHEPTQVKVLSPHHINKDTSPIMTNEANITNSLSPGVVDLRMKHHQSEFNGIANGNLSTYTPTQTEQTLPQQTGHSIDKYLNQIDTAPEKSEVQSANYVRASIIASNQQQSVPLDDLVNSAVDSHQMVPTLRPTNSSPNAMINHVATVVSPLSSIEASTVPSVQEPTADNSLLKSMSISTALMPIAEPIVTAPAAVSVPNVSVTSCNQLVANEAMLSVATQALVQQDSVAMQQQVQQVEQVVAQAQQQVEQVVAHVQQQAAQAVHQAQQQAVHQMVQHAHVIKQAVEKVQAVQQAPAAPAVQQAVQQETQEVVQQAMQQATHEVLQQVQSVQQAVQQAQAAQAMQQAVQQDIGSMLSQPAGFVAEASSALANGAAHEPSQQKLTSDAKQAISHVISVATKDIINNLPITTTTAHAIIATKNILNSVATQSAQLMNCAMEGILPKSPTAQQNMCEQVTSKSPPTVGLAMQSSNIVPQQTPMQQNNEPQPQTVPQQQSQQQQQQQQSLSPEGNVEVRKSDTGNNGMMTQDIITDHELLNYINSGCFDPQDAFFVDRL